jgi:hypothetical protein
MLEYSTLQDAFPNSVPNKKKKVIANEPMPVISDENSKAEPFETDYTGREDCYYKNNYSLNFPTCNNKNEKFDNQPSIKKVPCEPLQPPIYKIPVSNETQQSFENTYSTFVDNKNEKIKDYTSENQIKSKSLNNIKPYMNDDIEMYLNYEDIFNNINNNNNNNNNKITESFTTKPVIECNNSIKKETCDKLKSYLSYFEKKQEPKKEEPKVKIDYINILLFIFIGIIIILLCDQIANLAINIGIKRALEQNNINN